MLVLVHLEAVDVRVAPGCGQIRRVTVHQFVTTKGIGVQEGDAIADVKLEAGPIARAGECRSLLAIDNDAAGRIVRTGERRSALAINDDASGGLASTDDSRSPLVTQSDAADSTGMAMRDLRGLAMLDVVRSSLDRSDDAGLPLVNHGGVTVDANIHVGWTLQPHEGATAQKRLNIRGVWRHAIDESLIHASTVFATRITHETARLAADSVPELPSPLRAMLSRDTMVAPHAFGAVGWAQMMSTLGICGEGLAGVDVGGRREARSGQPEGCFPGWPVARATERGQHTPHRHVSDAWAPSMSRGGRDAPRSHTA